MKKFTNKEAGKHYKNLIDSIARASINQRGNLNFILLREIRKAIISVWVSLKIPPYEVVEDVIDQVKKELDKKPL